MHQYICVHGHFYQPPRENPWLQRIERQDSAAPFHDWNERIAAECYRPNTASRLRDEHGRIIGVVNNYARMSFNFGPTLLSWLEKHDSETYRGILFADQASLNRFGGHGSALAQVHSHVIMPLADRRDKEIQTAWGIQDFQNRFGRSPEGMWLPETAVDLESLEVLAEQGIKFTILAPHQAARVRLLGSDEWEDVLGARIDPTRAYLQSLPSGRTITLFFYDGPISRAIAFEGLLRSGRDFFERLTTGFNSLRSGPQLVHVATDGESYGHHHRFGDMALAEAYELIEADSAIEPINYGLFLERHPPEWEVDIIEHTAWSCAHGVERWRSNCGCNGGKPGWTQIWRGPLRRSLDFLRDELRPQLDAELASTVDDPPALLRELHPNLPGDSPRVGLLLELHRQLQLMYTSCGWFFDEISGIETVQLMMYSGRAIELAEILFQSTELRQEFLHLLAAASSNLPEFRDGRAVFEQFVGSAAYDWADGAAESVVRAAFADDSWGRHQVEWADGRPETPDWTGWRFGRVAVNSLRFDGVQSASFAIRSLGGVDIEAAIGPPMKLEQLTDRSRELAQLNDRRALERDLDATWGPRRWSLANLPRETREFAIGQLLQVLWRQVAGAHRNVRDRVAPLLRHLHHLGVVPPAPIRNAAASGFQEDLRLLLQGHSVDIEAIERLLVEQESMGVPIDRVPIRVRLNQEINRLTTDWRAGDHDVALMRRLAAIVLFSNRRNIEIDFWAPQNAWLEFRTKSWEGPARNWFAELGAALGMQVPPDAG